jgi:hypothetical protein
VMATESIDVANSNSSFIQGNFSNSRKTFIDCVYVDHDSYFGIDREVSKNETPQWKQCLKVMKRVEMSAESFIDSFRETKKYDSVPVFAVSDCCFWSLRDFGTSLMRHEGDQNASTAYSETSDKWPKYKRSLKTLASAIENYLRRQNIWNGSSSNNDSNKGTKDQLLDHSDPFTMLLYSKSDDRFDMITLSESSSPSRYKPLFSTTKRR